jgi:hypothetical protein
MSPHIKKIVKLTSLVFGVLIIISISFAYFYYLDLKKILVAKLSDKSTAFIGQRVDIGDLSFSPSAGMNFYDIVIENPTDFGPGRLLKIKKLYLKMKLSELFRARFHFENITVYSPELTVMRDRNGRFNISDKLKEFFERKTTISYQVDEFNIESGIIEFNKDKKYRNDSVTVNIKNLSSSSGTKTLIDAVTAYAGKNKISIKGWAYLKDEPKKFNVSVSTADIPLSGFQDILGRYKINTETAKIGMSLDAEGDTEAGVSCRAVFRIKDAGIAYLDQQIKHVQLSMDAFLSMRDNSILVRDLSLNSGNSLSVQLKAAVTGIKKSPAYTAEMRIKRADLSVFDLMKDITASGIITSDTIYLKGEFSKSLPEISGSFFVRAAALKRADGRNILKNASLNLKVTGDGRNLGCTADAGAGKLSLKLSGKIKRVMEKNREFEIRMNLPQTTITDIRNSFWDVFPDSLLYAGLDGSISSNALIRYRYNDLKVNGEIRLKDILLQGENGEYSVGPVKGVIPIVYSKRANKPEEMGMPSFERPEFNTLVESYRKETSGPDFTRITVGSLSYGFRLLEDMNMRLKQKGSSLNIGHFSGNIFGGRIDGSAVIDISKGLSYRAGFVLKGLSLTELCNGIEPIRGYISGKVDGIGMFKGAGAGLSRFAGKADFWTYSTGTEKTKISRDFLQRLGGVSLKAYLGDRKFDKGVMSLYLQNGFVTFKELEISHRNFLGITDLSVKVAPFSNRISIDHLMWSVTEAAQRAQKK